jgi:hypothetical protein
MAANLQEGIDKPEAKLGPAKVNRFRTSSRPAGFRINKIGNASVILFRDEIRNRIRSQILLLEWPEGNEVFERIQVSKRIEVKILASTQPVRRPPTWVEVIGQNGF